MPEPLRLLSIGEPLVELVHTGGDTLRRQVGGDTLNTAIYAARLIGPGRVGYQTRLGPDPLSDWMLERIGAEGIDTRAITRAPDAPVGLCGVHTDAAGERSFTYWRGQSAAREMLDPGHDADPGLFEILFTSAVTLAILTPAGRARLLDLMAEARAVGRSVALDLNLRPALWPDLEIARITVSAALRHASLVLPSSDDAALLWPGQSEDAAVREILAAGADEVVLTTGGGPVLHGRNGQVTRHPLPPPRRAIDTTGAGDAFNAGLLAARLAGAAIAPALAAAHRLAAHVTGFPGAVIPADRMPQPAAAPPG